MVEEVSLSAAEHSKFIEFVRTLFEETFDNVVFLIGYNCASPKSLANRVNFYFLGCASKPFC